MIVVLPIDSAMQSRSRALLNFVVDSDILWRVRLEIVDNYATSRDKALNKTRSVFNAVSLDISHVYHVS